MKNKYSNEVDIESMFNMVFGWDDAIHSLRVFKCSHSTVVVAPVSKPFSFTANEKEGD